MAHRRNRKGRTGPIEMSFLDVILCVLAVVVIVATASVIYINPPPVGEYKKTAKLSPTALFVQVAWQFNGPHDVDTYLKCVSHIGGRSVAAQVNFKQKSQTFLSLLVDDLGRPSPQNHEQAQVNSELERLPPNTICTLNAHLYSSHGGILPLPGRFHVILNKDQEDELVLTPRDGSPYELRLKGQEITLMTLVIDEHGAVLKDATALFPDAPNTCLATC